MNVDPIFSTMRVHCYYKDIYDISLLPAGSSNSGIARQFLPDGHVIGKSHVYDEAVKKLDPSLDMKKFRDHLANGSSVKEILINTKEESKVKEKVNRVETEEEKRLVTRLRANIKRKEKAVASGKDIRLINRIQRDIDFYQERLNNYERDNDSENDSDDVVIVPQRLTPVVLESKEVSRVREELSAERMGQNRPSVIARLRNQLNELENKRQEPEPDEDEIIEESINMARPTGRVNEDNVFDHLNLLQWRDKDEQKMMPSALNKIPIQTLNEMYPVMQQLAANLRTAIADKTGAVESLNDEERMNFLFHVMAKGRDLYWQSLCDPEFCLFMIDNSQPLYTYIKRKLNR